MLELLKKIFSLLFTPMESEKKGLGAEVNTPDFRDIQLASFQVPVSLPWAYETDISMLPVQDQKAHGSCVGQAEGLILAYFDYLENKNSDVSRRHIYARCKKEDGIPDIQGTYPRVAAGIISKRGATTSKIIADDNSLPYSVYLAISESDATLKDAITRKANYAFVALDATSLKQAIYQNKLVSITLYVDYDSWRQGKLTAPKKFVGGHRVVLYGWDGDDFKFRNSWSEQWGDNGCGEFYFDDYEPYMQDPICYTDIPNEILEDAKNSAFIFTQTMRFGSRGFEVKKLQERLNILPEDGIFGKGTKSKVIQYQASVGLVADGIVGAGTRAKLNGKIISSKLDLWCEAIKAHEGWYAGSRSYRNKNPGNIKHVGQARAVGKDSAGFCIFATYEDGYSELKDMLVRCATKPDSSTYWADMTLLQFFQKYAPSADDNNPAQYAKAVAKKIGCEVGTPIKNLII